MRYGIGLDIGVTSVGWAVMKLDEKDEPCRILDMGSRIFEASENPKDGASLAEPRRTSRSMRRRLRRRRHRKERIRMLLETLGVMTVQQVEELYKSPKFDTDVYELRSKALDTTLTRDEFVRVLIQLSQRRGFKSNRKIEGEKKDSESGLLTTAVTQNAELMVKNGYRTVGEMLFKDTKFESNKRNKSESYSNTVLRELLCDEIVQIFTSQRSLGNSYATQELEEKYLSIYTSQRSFEDGPGGESPYGGNHVLKMLGKCIFEPEQYRAWLAQYSFEYFNLLQKVNAIRLIDANGKRALAEHERKAVVELARSKADINYSTIRKTLAVDSNILFNITYGDKELDAVEKKTKFNYLKAYHVIKKAYGDAYKYLTKEKLNAIGESLSAFKNDSKIAEYLAEKGLAKEEIDLALKIPTFSKSANISIKACDKLIPFLEQGMVYSDACTAAGYNFKGNTEHEKTQLLPTVAPELSDINNPVVRRAISQTIKVVNSIIRRYSTSPCFISVELARELSHNFTDRKRIEKEQKQRYESNQSLIDEIKRVDKKINVTGMDLLKLKLWQEQDGICPYSLKRIPRDKLFEAGYTDIDHIIPYSLSFDDSFVNKVLVLASENRQKGNRLPLQYIKNKDQFIVWVNNTVRDRERRRRLLKEEFSEKDESEWKARSLNDTKYISRFVHNYISKYLLFAPNNTDRKKTVMAVSGGATAYIRKRWGINKIREDGDLHHAVDAAVVACVTDGMIRKIARYSKYHEVGEATADMYDGVDENTGELLNHFPYPYPWFRKELEMRLLADPQDILQKLNLPNYSSNEQIAPLFVSRMPRHKVTGSAHKETIRSSAASGSGLTISKVLLTSLKLNNEGEIEGYYNPESDRLLYEALRKQLVMYNKNAAAAFASKFYKPKSDGTQGPEVKKVKVIQKSTLNVSVHDGKAVADNGDMIRVDVFYVENDGYYLVPIYVSDTVAGILPNKAIIAHKPYSEWKQMSDNDFVFSLYPSDLIKVSCKKATKLTKLQKESKLPENMFEKEFFAYYVSSDISAGAIAVINHDKTYGVRGLGVKTIPLIEKYQVGVLGEINKVGKEIRQYFR